MDARLRCRPLSAGEATALRRARRALLRGTIAFMLAVGAGAACLVVWGADRDPYGVLPLVALLCAAWVYVLRRMPTRLVAATRDLRGGGACVVSGPAGLRQRRGFGLFAPTFHELVLEGERYGLAPDQSLQVREGMSIETVVAPTSRVLLSLAPATPALVGPADAGIDPGVAARQGLTPREADLLRLIAAGRTDKAIARELGLEPATVRTYNSQLYAKLGVSRRTEAVARAQALGLLTRVED